jgi:serine/threonine-protein kinase
LLEWIRDSASRASGQEVFFNGLLAKHVNPLTMMATASGTRCFKPPEVFRDLRSDSCAGDVWALGVTLYLLLADRLPYPDLEGVGALDEAFFQRPVLPASRLNIKVDSLLDSIIQRALAIRIEERYHNARELLDDLNRWGPETPVRRIEVKKTTEPWLVSKSALGPHTPADELKARGMSARAITLSKQASQLAEAADLMEEAFNYWPDLRQEYEYQVKLWRCGIIM